MTNCGRCYALKGIVKKGWIRIVDPSGNVDHICKECHEEIETVFINENEEDKAVS